MPDKNGILKMSMIFFFIVIDKPMVLGALLTYLGCFAQPMRDRCRFCLYSCYVVMKVNSTMLPDEVDDNDNSGNTKMSIRTAFFFLLFSSFFLKFSRTFRLDME